MGSKRIGLARTEALLENLKRELSLTNSTLNGVKVGLPSTVTEDTTLTAADSNKVIRFDIASSDVTVTLPSASAGLTFKFLCVGAGAKSLLVDSGSGVTITGATYLKDVSAGSVTRAAHSNRILGFGDNHLVGDQCEIICDGTNWHIISAWSGVAWVTS